MCKSLPQSRFRQYHDGQDFPPTVALIASGTDRELAKYVEFLKEENKILRTRIPGQVHTKPDERRKLVHLVKALGRGVEALLTIVSVSTFYRWCRDEKAGKKKQNPKCGQRKPREIRELVMEIAKLTGFGYTRIIGEMRKLGIKRRFPQAEIDSHFSVTNLVNALFFAVLRASV